MGKMIFHVPLALDAERLSGSHIRPRRMIEAFKNLEDEVFVIEGDSGRRKKLCADLLARMDAGEQFDYCYAETSTMPTELTDPDHHPRYMGADFSFFKALKKRGVPTGVFYRDCYWCFDVYKKTVPFFKRIIAEHFYRRELAAYRKWMDIVFMPHESMQSHLPRSFKKVAALPPAVDKIKPTPFSQEGPLRLFYVGGVGALYDMTLLFDIVAAHPVLSLCVCTRQDEWEKEKERYAPFLCDRMTIIHGGEEVYRPYLEQADLCTIIMKPDPYRDIAVPVKLFTYIAYEKPVLATRHQAILPILDEVGYGVSYNREDLAHVLLGLASDKSQLKEKKQAVCAYAKKNTWADRARRVRDTLIEIKERR